MGSTIETEPIENQPIEEQIEPEYGDYQENPDFDEDKGVPTGGAARIDREKEPKEIEDWHSFSLFF